MNEEGSVAITSKKSTDYEEKIFNYPKKNNEKLRSFLTCYGFTDDIHVELKRHENDSNLSSADNAL